MALGKDKVRPDWPIDIETAEMFREFVVKKYGTYSKGLFGHELNRIILAGIKKSGGKTMAHAHVINQIRIHNDNSNEQKAKAIELRDMVVAYLIERLRIEAQPKIRVGLAMLKGAICDVSRVTDHRAIKSRITLLESSGLVSQSDMEFKLYEIITGYDHMAKPPRGVVG